MNSRPSPYVCHLVFTYLVPHAATAVRLFLESWNTKARAYSCSICQVSSKAPVKVVDVGDKSWPQPKRPILS